MRANSVDIKKSMESISLFIVEYIIEQLQISKDEALLKFTNTVTYEALIDKETKLFSESREYVLDMFIKEIQGDINGWLQL